MDIGSKQTTYQRIYQKYVLEAERTEAEDEPETQQEGRETQQHLLKIEAQRGEASLLQQHCSVATEPPTEDSPPSVEATAPPYSTLEEKKAGTTGAIGQSREGGDRVHVQKHNATGGKRQQTVAGGGFTMSFDETRCFPEVVWPYFAIVHCCSAQLMFF